MAQGTGLIPNETQFPDKPRTCLIPPTCPPHPPHTPPTYPPHTHHTTHHMPTTPQSHYMQTAYPPHFHHAPVQMFVRTVQNTKFIVTKRLRPLPSTTSNIHYQADVSHDRCAAPTPPLPLAHRQHQFQRVGVRGGVMDLATSISASNISLKPRSFCRTASLDPYPHVNPWGRSWH